MQTHHHQHQLHQRQHQRQQQQTTPPTTLHTHKEHHNADDREKGSANGINRAIWGETKIRQSTHTKKTKWQASFSFLYLYQEGEKEEEEKKEKNHTHTHTQYTTRTRAQQSAHAHVRVLDHQKRFVSNFAEHLKDVPNSIKPLLVCPAWVLMPHYCFASFSAFSNNHFVSTFKKRDKINIA